MALLKSNGSTALPAGVHSISLTFVQGIFRLSCIGKKANYTDYFIRQFCLKDKSQPCLLKGYCEFNTIVANDLIGLQETLIVKFKATFDMTHPSFELIVGTSIIIW